MGYLWMVFYCLVGVFSSENYFCKEDKPSSKEKIYATILCLVSGASIFFIFQRLLLPSYFHEVKWLLIGASIPASKRLASKITSN